MPLATHAHPRTAAPQGKGWGSPQIAARALALQPPAIAGRRLLKSLALIDGHVGVLLSQLLHVVRLGVAPTQLEAVAAVVVLLVRRVAPRPADEAERGQHAQSTVRPTPQHKQVTQKAVDSWQRPWGAHR